MKTKTILRIGVLFWRRGLVWGNGIKWLLNWIGTFKKNVPPMNCHTCSVDGRYPAPVSRGNHRNIISNIYHYISIMATGAGQATVFLWVSFILPFHDILRFQRFPSSAGLKRRTKLKHTRQVQSTANNMAGLVHPSQFLLKTSQHPFAGQPWREQEFPPEFPSIFCRSCTIWRWDGGQAVGLFPLWIASFQYSKQSTLLLDQWVPFRDLQEALTTISMMFNLNPQLNGEAENRAPYLEYNM